MTAPLLLPTNWDDHWKTLRGSSLLEALRIRSIRRAYRRLLQGCGLPSAPRILELGAGSGNASLQLVRLFGGEASLPTRGRPPAAGICSRPQSRSPAARRPCSSPGSELEALDRPDSPARRGPRERSRSRGLNALAAQPFR